MTVSCGVSERDKQHEWWTSAECQRRSVWTYLAEANVARKLVKNLKKRRRGTRDKWSRAPESEFKKIKFLCCNPGLRFSSHLFVGCQALLHVERVGLRRKTPSDLKHLLQMRRNRGLERRAMQPEAKPGKFESRRDVPQTRGPGQP